MTAAFRVTQRSIGVRALHGLQHNLDRLGQLQQQLSSGREISRPSDSPTGAVSALQLRSEVRASEQYARNASDGLGWLGTVDEALTGSLGLLNRAKSLTLQGMSTGSSSPSSRAALAAEVSALRENLLGVANTRYLDRPVFGGTTPGGTAYDASASYVGDGNSVSRTVGDGARVRVDVTGPEVFGSGTSSVFQVLDDIATHLTADPASLEADLGRLEAAFENVLNRLADVGARYNRVDQMRQKSEDSVTSLRNSLAEVESVDLPKTIVELQMQEVAYQAALGATQRIVQPSLVDFLR